MKKSVMLWLVFGFFLLDMLLKKVVFTLSSAILLGNVSVHFNILPFVCFDLAYVENTGMAWGMFSSFQFLILAIRMLLIAVIGFGMMKSKSIQSQIVPYALIFFGAVGNVIDTFVYGHVIDMLHFTFWGNSYGIFNIADAMIFLGAIFIIFSRKRPYAIKE